MLAVSKGFLLVTAVSLVALTGYGQDEKSFVVQGNVRQGKDLLDWIGLGTGPETDPYLARTNSACLEGDLAECFKSRALSSLDEFFNKPEYQLSENARVIRLPESQLRNLAHESYEFSETPRANEPEWDQLLKFVMRKVEKFMKSTGIEMVFDNEVTQEGRYSPRFVDEIVDEIDLIEDKKDSLFKRKQLKKLFIPLLLVLKIFKLKLLLFLPLILGLASFKKLLGFLAIIVPGIIAFLKFCKPDVGSPFTQGNYFNNPPHYSPAGIGYQPHFREPQPNFAQSGSSYGGSYGGGVHFREDDHAQNLAYSGYSHYRNNDAADIEAEKEAPRKKSILPDS